MAGYKSKTPLALDIVDKTKMGGVANTESMNGIGNQLFEGGVVYGRFLNLTGAILFGVVATIAGLVCLRFGTLPDTYPATAVARIDKVHQCETTQIEASSYLATAMHGNAAQSTTVQNLCRVSISFTTQDNRRIEKNDFVVLFRVIEGQEIKIQYDPLAPERFAAGYVPPWHVATAAFVVALVSAAVAYFFYWKSTNVFLNIATAGQSIFMGHGRSVI